MGERNWRKLAEKALDDECERALTLPDVQAHGYAIIKVSPYRYRAIKHTGTAIVWLGLSNVHSWQFCTDPLTYEDLITELQRLCKEG